MCSICGVFNFGDDGVDRHIISDMSKVARHRGPDDKGVFVDKNIGLGHRRLSIIDLKTGRQPIHNEDGSIWIVFNGEIYNYLELKSFLEKEGHKFYTNTDTEVIVHLYEVLGEGCVDKLRGMFSFAIWDGNNKKLFLAVDRLGEKPLYYAVVGDNLVFASEIKSILQFPEIDRKVNPNSLYNYLRFFYVPGPDTLFEGIYKLLPGHILTCDYKNNISVAEYWDVKFSYENRSEEYFIDRLYKLLSDSVRMRLISDVPIGAFLSGGIDSSFIVGLMSQMTEEPVKTFSVGFEREEIYNEFKYAQMAAEHFGTDHHKITVSERDIVDKLPLMVWHLDEPVADLSIVPFYFVSKLAKRHVKVALSGEGSDELFAGYPIYPMMLRHLKMGRYYNKVPKHLRGSTSKIFEKMPGNVKGKGFFLLNEYSALEKLYFGPNTDPTFDKWSEELLSPDFKNTTDNFEYTEVYNQYFKKTKSDTLAKMLYGDMKTWLPWDLLMRADKTTMANAVETRIPFLDHELVEFSATIPSQLKLGHGVSKYILKKSASAIVPKEIIDREKMGFFARISPNFQWFDGELKEAAIGILDEADRRWYLCPGSVKKLVEEHKRGLKDNSYKIWALSNLEHWHRIFIDPLEVKCPP